MGNVPGTLGMDGDAGSPVGWRCLTGLRMRSKFGLPDATPGTLGMNDWAWERANARPEVKLTDEEKAEADLDLLRRLYGPILDKNAKAYSKRVRDKKTRKDVWTHRAADYLKDRNAMFGSAEAYADYLETAQEELDAKKARLRFYVEPQKSVRSQHADWKKGQDIFYAWTRKTFEKQYGEDNDLARLILIGMNEKLKNALAQVRADYDGEFASGGFNPRPMKLSGCYRFGTISDHAIGTAVDIDDDSNAQIDQGKWSHVLKYADKTSRSGERANKWKGDAAQAKQVYDEIKGINDAWVEKLARAVKDETDAQAKRAAAVKPGEKAPPAKPPLEVVVEANEHLKKLGIVWVRKWQDGFMDLEWDLVKELHEEGLTWGAVFPDVDIHHFQL